jgi:hypothetical protein
MTHAAASIFGRYKRPLLHGTSIAGILLLVYIFVTVPGPGYDAFAYWHLDLHNLYPAFEGFGAYRYPPPFAQLVAPLGALPWPVFLAGWTIMGFVALVAVAGRASLAWLAFPPVSAELFIGNIHLPIALAIVHGFRRPALWAFILLTKPTCCVALLWFFWRREWRSLAIALGTTAVIAGVSFIVAPGLWTAWLDSQLNTPIPNWPGIGGPLIPRLALAALVVSIGALTNRRWTVPVAVMLSLPFVWIHSLAILVAVVPLLREARKAAPAEGPSRSPWAPRFRRPALSPAGIPALPTATA